MIKKLQTEFGISQAVTIAPGINGLPKVVLAHESGSRAEVYLHAGHVTSWTNAKGDELLFLSREALFAPGKEIRGGIPVCFPQFSDQGPLPPHGFARNSEWHLVKTEVLGTGKVAARLQLTESEDSLAIWPHKFALVLGVLLDMNALTISTQVVNTGADSFQFQTALHTYFRVADIHRTSVRGLEGVSFIDAVREYRRDVETGPSIRFSEETDRIYVDAPDSLRLDDEGNGRSIVIQKRDMPDVVVWNPWIEKSHRMSYLGDEEYLRIVCVETGRIVSPCELSPRDQWQGETTFSC